MSAIDDAINAAKAQAASAQQGVATASGDVAGQVPAAVAPNVTALPTAQNKLSADDMLTGSFSVDAFAKVSEDGIKINESALIEKLLVSINLSEVYYYFAVKYGNPAVYKKTTNRQVATDGTPWQQVLQTASAVGGASFKGDYRAADVPMTLLVPAVDLKDKEAAPAGHRIGKSLSTTEWREWEGLLRAVKAAGLDPDGSVIQVAVGYKKRTSSTNTWGVLTFEFIGEYVDDSEAEEAA